MIVLRIIAGIVGLWAMWVFVFVEPRRSGSVWEQAKDAVFLTIVFVAAFIFLQLALAGHL